MADTSKRGAAIASVSSGIILTVMKFIVGLAAGSLAILSEAAHSLLDLFAAILTLFVVHIGDQPPDENHPYGHAKAENLGALAESALLVATAGWVLWHAYDRIFIRPEIPELTIWSFIVMAGSVVIDYTRARALKRAAREHNSQALAADAAHFTNDMLGATVVLISLGLIELSRVTTFMPVWFVERVDAFGGAIVALIALKVSWTLGRAAVRALMEDVPTELNQRLAAVVEGVEFVVPRSARLRSRFVGQQAFVDVSFRVPRSLTLEASHAVVERVESAIQSELPLADITARVEPSRVEAEELAETVFTAAGRLGMPVHHLGLLNTSRGLKILLDLEVPSSTVLADAHAMSDRLARELRAEIEGEPSVFIHLEARDAELRPAVAAETTCASVRTVLSSWKFEAPPEVHAWTVDDGTIVVLEARFPADTPVVSIHREISAIEAAIMASVPEVIRVHVDPHTAR